MLPQDRTTRTIALQPCSDWLRQRPLPGRTRPTPNTRSQDHQAPPLQRFALLGPKIERSGTPLRIHIIIITTRQQYRRHRSSSASINVTKKRGMRVLQRPDTRGREVDRMRTTGAGLAYRLLPLRPLHQSTIIIINMATTIMITNKAAVSIVPTTTNNKDRL